MFINVRQQLILYYVDLVIDVKEARIKRKPIQKTKLMRKLVT